MLRESDEIFQKAVRTTWTKEWAWPVIDIKEGLSYAKRNKLVISGGDVLRNDFSYTYDSWYYEIDPNIDHDTNVRMSMDMMNDYVSKYIERNGTEYYVIPVFHL